MKVYVVNAFTKQEFGGNPAAVMVMDTWLPDNKMQQIAAQHNLAETAFVVPKGADFEIRWFTPTVEVDLCGHATLASAHVFFNHLGFMKDRIIFHSRSGPLPVKQEKNGQLILDFPENPPSSTDMVPDIEAGLHVRPLEIYISRFDYLALLGSQAELEKLSPDFGILGRVKARGLIVTAKGSESDFVSRCFFPQSGIDEDSVTGSAYTVLMPFWAEKLGKNKLSAIQLSKRKGYLDCERAGDRILIGGYARTYLFGEIYID